MSGNEQRPGGWVNGIGWVVRMNTLAAGDKYVYDDDGSADEGITWTYEARPDEEACTDLCIVTRWADGTVPEAPGAHRPDHFSTRSSGGYIHDVYCACGWHHAAMSSGETLAAHREHVEAARRPAAEPESSPTTSPVPSVDDEQPDTEAMLTPREQAIEAILHRYQDQPFYVTAKRLALLAVPSADAHRVQPQPEIGRPHHPCLRCDGVGVVTEVGNPLTVKCPACKGSRYPGNWA